LSFVASAIFTIMTPDLPEFIAFSLLFLVLIMIKVSFQKMIAIVYGYRADFYMNTKWGIVPTLLFIIFPYPFKLFYTGTIKIFPVSKLRIGYKTKSIRLKSKGLVSVAGVFPIILLLVIFKALNITFGAYQDINVILYMFVFFSLLPVFHYDGFNLVYASRTTYLFLIVLIGLFLILINLISSIFWAFVVAFLFTSVSTIMYYLQKEITLRE